EAPDRTEGRDFVPRRATRSAVARVGEVATIERPAAARQRRRRNLRQQVSRIRQSRRRWGWHGYRGEPRGAHVQDAGHAGMERANEPVVPGLEIRDSEHNPL